MKELAHRNGLSNNNIFVHTNMRDFLLLYNSLFKFIYAGNIADGLPTTSHPLISE